MNINNFYLKKTLYMIILTLKKCLNKYPVTRLRKKFKPISITYINQIFYIEDIIPQDRRSDIRKHLVYFFSSIIFLLYIERNIYYFILIWIIPVVSIECPSEIPVANKYSLTFFNTYNRCINKMFINTYERINIFYNYF